MNTDKNKQLELILQRRSSKRVYVFDYHAFIRDSTTNIIDPFGNGGGLSVDLEDAKIRAIGEAIERYCGSHINNKLLRKSYDNVKKNAINPKKLIYFSNKQYVNKFLYKKFNSRKTIDWIEGYSMTRKKKVLVPAFAVYLGYNRLINKDEHFMPTSSCGLASHNSIENAINSSLLELIERDSAITTWMHKKKVLRLDINSIKSEKLISLKNKILEEGLEMEICITPNNFLILSVIAIIYNQKKEIPFASFGMAAGSNIEKVVTKSLEEALMVRNTLEIQKKENKFKKIQKLNIKNYIDHAAYYSLPSHKNSWQFLLNSPRVSVEIIKKNLDNTMDYKKIINLLKKENKEVILVDLTNKLIKKMGFYCVKIIIPELRPMDFDYKTRFLRDLKNTFNNDPHPFT